MDTVDNVSVQHGLHDSTLETDVSSGLITKLGHFDIFDAESTGIVCSPFNGNLVVEIRPGRVMTFGFAFFGDRIHEAPSIIESAELELASDGRFGWSEFPCREL